MSDPDPLLTEAQQELDEGEALLKKAQRELARRYRAIRKQNHACQDCGATIARFSRCPACRRKRNGRRLAKPA